MKPIALILLALSLMAFQQPAPEGVAKSCNNESDVPSHNCHCAMTSCPKPGDEPLVPDSKCKTWCAPKNCHCCPECKSPTTLYDHQ